MRFEETPDLFGGGMGSGSTDELICEWCGNVYERQPACGDSVSFTHFGNKQICYCCFEKVENAVLKRMPAILKWYRRLLDAKKKQLKETDKNLKKVEDGK